MLVPIMKILLVGGGGREHALAWKLAGESGRPQVHCAPGNAGTAAVAVNVPVEAEDGDGIVRWAREQRPDLTVIGPEAPLCAGLADRLLAEGVPTLGPGRAGAQLEGSKSFAKEVMAAAGVPTAAAQVFDDAQQALQHVRRQSGPMVIKADGLAAGKGVSVCATVAEAEQALESIMVSKVFGAAGARVVVEECLEGEEVSILALVDGETALPLASAQDHKRAFNNDEGPNTGGMGAYSPAPALTDALWPVVREEVFGRTLAELRRRGIPYRGVLYAGLMIDGAGRPKALEFNCRFGDPETQAILPRIQGDFLPALQACASGTLREDLVQWRPEVCVSVVMASGGYPGDYAKGKPIEGLAAAEALPGVRVFHAGTAVEGGQVVSAGGRVLGVTALGEDYGTAVQRAYQAVSRLRFDQAQYRTDIAGRALKRERAT